MVARPVAFYAQCVSTRLIWVDDRKVYEEADSSYLVDYPVADSNQGASNFLFERRVRLALTRLSYVHITGLGVLQEPLENSGAYRSCAFNVDIIRDESR